MKSRKKKKGKERGKMGKTWIYQVMEGLFFFIKIRAQTENYPREKSTERSLYFYFSLHYQIDILFISGPQEISGNWGRPIHLFTSRNALNNKESSDDRSRDYFNSE